MAPNASAHDKDQPLSVPTARRWRRGVWGSAAALALVPVLLQLTSSEMAWSAGDFLAFALLLGAAGGLCELAARFTRGIGNLHYRAAVGVAVATAFLVVWVNAAVGFVGEPDHPANLMFVGIPALGFIAAFLLRGSARGMAACLLAMALAQGLAGGVAAVNGWQLPLAATLGFAGLWLLSAALFAWASRAPQPAPTSQFAP